MDLQRDYLGGLLSRRLNLRKAIIVLEILAFLNVHHLT